MMNDQVIMGTLKIKPYLATVKVQKLTTEVEPVKDKEVGLCDIFI